MQNRLIKYNIFNIWQHFRYVRTPDCCIIHWLVQCKCMNFWFSEFRLKYWRQQETPNYHCYRRLIVLSWEGKLDKNLFNIINCVANICIHDNSNIVISPATLINWLDYAELYGIAKRAYKTFDHRNESPKLLPLLYNMLNWIRGVSTYDIMFSGLVQAKYFVFIESLVNITLHW
jgi:hypothetical protein